MDERPIQPEQRTPRDAGYWAKPAPTLHLTGIPPGGMWVTVEGRRVVGPIQGFGRLWQKTFRTRLHGVSVTPAEVIRTWKEHFPDFWPPGNHFYAPLAGIKPGEVALLTVSPNPRSPIRFSTGVLVLYADAESFSFMTPEGHMLAAWITFSAWEEDGLTIVQAQALERTNDPLYELGAILGGHTMNNRFWEGTLRSLAQYYGVDAEVETLVICLDRRWQWSRAGNLRHNAAIRSAIHDLRQAPTRIASSARRIVERRGRGNA